MTNWQQQQIGIGVERCPTDPTNTSEPADRITQAQDRADDVTNTTTATRFVGSGITINITNLPYTDAAAIAAKTRHALRTDMTPRPHLSTKRLSTWRLKRELKKHNRRGTTAPTKR